MEKIGVYSAPKTVLSLALETPTTIGFHGEAAERFEKMLVRKGFKHARRVLIKRSLAQRIPTRRVASRCILVLTTPSSSILFSLFPLSTRISLSARATRATRWRIFRPLMHPPMPQLPRKRHTNALQVPSSPSEGKKRKPEGERQRERRGEVILVSLF